ncbi:MAG: DUF2231 domain-containing protein [Vicinamibacterales bacterium]
MMSLVPSWAPNVHPLVIHFPIGLWVTAVAIDLVDALFERPAWLGAAATSLYVAGAAAAIVAYLTGVQAGSTVFVPGMAYPLIDDHNRWAVVTVWFFAAVAVLRLAVWRLGIPRRRLHRVLLLVTGLTGILLLQQTAERGARLVYEHGVGVIAAPQSP